MFIYDNIFVNGVALLIAWVALSLGQLGTRGLCLVDFIRSGMLHDICIYCMYVLSCFVLCVVCCCDQQTCCSCVWTN